MGADDFAEIEVWTKEKLDWFRRVLKLVHGIASHDTFGCVFTAIDAAEIGAPFRRWVSSAVPARGKEGGRSVLPVTAV